MSAETLSACILQALLNHPLTAPSFLSNMSSSLIQNRLAVVGLFCESNCVFVSLQHLVLSNRDTQQQRHEIYAPNFNPPPTKPPTAPPSPWWQQHHIWLFILLPPALCAAAYYYSQEILDMTIWTAQATYELLVHTPLAELYRHGPWFLGWEGADLPSICARITYHGDSAFWYRNLEECQRIYAAKEEAWLRLARPLVWGIWMLAALLVVRFIIWELWSAPPPPQPAPPVDRDMVDLYRAWQVLLRQFHRAAMPPTEPPPQPRRQQQQQPQRPQHATSGTSAPTLRQR